MWVIRACVAALAVSLAVGAPAASAATVSIKPKKRVIDFGKSTKITGHLSANPNASVRVELQRKRYPYTETFQTTAAKKTDSKGNYAFTAKPDRNTRYRILVPSSSTESGQRSIYVNGLGTISVKTVKPNTAKAKFTFSFSPQLDMTPFRGVTVYWYLRVDRKGGSNKFHLIRKNTTRRLGEGQIGGSLKYKLPASVGKNKYTIKDCFQPSKTGDVGVGAPGAFKACPKH